MSFASVFDQPWLALSMMESSSMSPGARIALLVLAGLLLLILGCLILFGVVLRKRAREIEPGAGAESRGAMTAAAHSELEGAEYSTAGRSFSRASSGGGLEVARADALVCPTCRREYGRRLSFCPHDARRLVPASEMLDPGRKEGSICPGCKRSFDSGVRFCPHDASELIPVAVYTATARLADRNPTGVIAKICPKCQRRYDLSASFCAQDSTELVVIN